MKETGPAELMEFTWRGGIDTEEKVLSQAPSRSHVSFGVFVSFSPGKIYIFCQVFHESALQLGHTVMHACTYAHKHSDVRTQLLPRYIIISTLYRLCAVLDLWRGRREERGGEGAQSRCASREQRVYSAVACTRLSAIQLFVIHDCTSGHPGLGKKNKWDSDNVFPCIISQHRHEHAFLRGILFVWSWNICKNN